MAALKGKKIERKMSPSKTPQLQAPGSISRNLCSLACLWLEVFFGKIKFHKLGSLFDILNLKASGIGIFNIG